MPETRTLTCDLTAPEREARGAELARATHDWESAEEEKKSITKTLGEKIKEHESNMKRLSRVVRLGKEEREVEVYWVPYASSETMRLFRRDTGEEINSRPMTKEEKDLYRQAPLPLPPVDALQLPPGREIAPEPPPPVRLLPAAEEEEIEDVDFEELPPTPTR